jgi:hypothetical protein
MKHKILNEFIDGKTKERIKPGAGDDGYYEPRDEKQLERLVRAGCLDPNDTRSERPKPASGGSESDTKGKAGDDAGGGEGKSKDKGKSKPAASAGEKLPADSSGS